MSVAGLALRGGLAAIAISLAAPVHASSLFETLRKFQATIARIAAIEEGCVKAGFGDAEQCHCALASLIERIGLTGFGIYALGERPREIDPQVVAETPAAVEAANAACGSRFPPPKDNSR